MDSRHLVVRIVNPGVPLPAPDFRFIHPAFVSNASLGAKPTEGIKVWN